MRLILAAVFAGVIFLIQYELYRFFWRRKLDVEIGFERNMLYEQESNELRTVIINRKRLPLPMLQVKFSITRTFIFDKEDNSSVTDQYYRNEFFTVKSMQKITRTYPFICSHRGLFRMNSMDIIGRSFFLDNKMIVTQTFDAGVCVLPRKIESAEIPTEITNLTGDIERNIHINEDPFTFAGIRDYQPFDSMHSINWKVTARMDGLQVNTYNATFSKKIVVLLNVESNSMQRAQDIIEWSIRIAAYLAEFFIRKHIPIALICNGVDCVDRGMIDIKSGADMAHIRTIEVALARLEIPEKPNAFSNLMSERIIPGNDNTEYIIVSNSRKRNIVEKYEDLKKHGNKISFVIPEYSYISLEDGIVGPQYTKWAVTDEDEKLSTLRGYT